MRVLVTRPAEDSIRTAEALVAAGYDPLVVPLARAVGLPVTWGDVPDAVLATSANAVRLLTDPPAALLRCPLFVVGGATASAARAAGFQRLHVADGNAETLAALVLKALPAQSRLLYMAGRARRDVAIQGLSDRYALQTLEVYEIVRLPDLPETLAEALRTGSLEAALHFSRLSSDHVVDLVEAAGLLEAFRSLLHVAIASQAMDPRLPNWRIARDTTLDAMIGALS